MKLDELRPIVVYSRDAVLEIEHVAAALGCGRGTAEKMDLPFCWVGARQRFLWGQCLDELAERARKGDTRIRRVG